ncbi:hypothetical protein QTP86_022133, partial [Hemibagrus guttatus]
SRIKRDSSKVAPVDELVEPSGASLQEEEEEVDLVGVIPVGDEKVIGAQAHSESDHADHNGHANHDNDHKNNGPGHKNNGPGHKNNGNNHKNNNDQAHHGNNNNHHHFDRCSELVFDAAIEDKEGVHYFFKDDHVFKGFHGDGELTNKTFPELDNHLLGHVDAAFHMPSEDSPDHHEHLYFFLDDKVFSYENHKLEDGYPKAISEVFPGIPDHLDAAVECHKPDCPNNTVVFFKGHEIYHFDIDTKEVHEKEFQSMPNCSAAFRYAGHYYCLHGHDFSKFNPNTGEVHGKYPKEAREYFMSCPHYGDKTEAEHIEREQCSHVHLDAITEDDDHDIFAFRGHHYLSKIDDKYHAGTIESAFKGLHDDIDAAFSHENHIHIIKGDKVYVYDISHKQGEPHTLREGYPKSVKDVLGLEGHIDAAFICPNESIVHVIQGKGRELADVMERRNVDILCVQETRWKGSKARSIGAGFKLFYYGVDSKRNGVGVVLKEEFVRNVLEVKRVSDRVMSLKLEIEGVILNVVSGYAPQVGCELEEKERFWSELDEVMESIPTGERVVIGADFNGHVGEGNTGDEEVMGKFEVKERNLEGQMVVDFAKRMDMGVVIFRRWRSIKMTLMVCKKKRSEIEKKTKWWKLKKEECCEEFRQKLRQALGGQVLLPDDWETTAKVIRETGRKVLGVSSGRRKEDKETWWWNEEVQDSIQRKRLAKKKWDLDRTEENRQEYKELQRRVKREVSKAKQKAYDELYTRLDTREGEKDLYRLARQRDRDGKDVQQVRVIKDRDGRVLTSEESVQRRWKEYFEELMNEENEREKKVEGVNSVEQKVDKIRKDEVRKALKRMKSGKAVGPDDIPVEVWKCLGEAAVEFLASLFNRVLESERMPEEWRRSVLVPIFKNKGDVQSCSNYRGIKLMSHTMKLWERVVEARLRKVVEICEQQYGFMPRKSTTDAIFALRILMEKYRDGQRELHCVFVDLEKAYDRVPREELWYCMRKSGVAEKYVRVVQDMYERSRTVVRCAVGQTEEFNVEVGLHQGSALSPFLFAIVMDQLSEEVRQESPWTMMFADDIVICSESREQVEENLERWRFALERRGMKVSRSKTEYMCVNEREGSGTVRLQGEELKKVQEFKYLGSTVQSSGECGKEVKKRVQAGWNGWRKVSGVLCDRKISARIKGKVYRTVVRPAMLYGLETVPLRKRQESELEVAELKMLRSEGHREAGGASEKHGEASGGGARSKGEASRGKRGPKARQVGGSEDQGKASGGSEKQKQDKWVEHGTRRQGQRVPSDIHNRAEAPSDVHRQAAELSNVHCQAAGLSDIHHRAAAPGAFPAEQSRRAMSTGKRQSRAPILVQLGPETPQGAGGRETDTSDNLLRHPEVRRRPPRRNKGGAASLSETGAERRPEQKPKTRNPGRKPPLQTRSEAASPTEKPDGGATTGSADVKEMAQHLKTYFLINSDRLAKQVPLIEQYHVLDQYFSQLQTSMLSMIGAVKNEDGGSGSR